MSYLVVSSLADMPKTVADHGALDLVTLINAETAVAVDRELDESSPSQWPAGVRAASRRSRQTEVAHREEGIIRVFTIRLIIRPGAAKRLAGPQRIDKVQCRFLETCE